MTLPLDEQLCFALYAASRAMTAAYGPLLAELGLTYPQYLVMLDLWQRDGARVSDLGDQLHLDSATLTPLLKRLESFGLLERQRSALDERVVQVFLTPDGKRLRRRCTEIPLAMLAKSGLTMPELVRLRTTLQDVTRRLRTPSATASRARRAPRRRP